MSRRSLPSSSCHKLRSRKQRHMTKILRYERSIVIIVVRKLELIKATWSNMAIMWMTFWPSLLNWNYARIKHLILWRKGHLKCYRSPVQDLSAACLKTNSNFLWNKLFEELLSSL